MSSSAAIQAASAGSRLTFSVTLDGYGTPSRTSVSTCAVQSSPSSAPLLAIYAAVFSSMSAVSSCDAVCR